MGVNWMSIVSTQIVKLLDRCAWIESIGEKTYKQPDLSADTKKIHIQHNHQYKNRELIIFYYYKLPVLFYLRPNPK